jgi:hypothetical protein
MMARTPKQPTDSNLPSLEQVRNAGINDLTRYNKATAAIQDAERIKYQIDLANAERLYNANKIGVVIDGKIVKLAGNALAALAKSWEIGKTVAYKLINVHDQIGKVVPWADEIFKTTGHWPSRDAMCDYANPEAQPKLPSPMMLLGLVEKLKGEITDLKMSALLTALKDTEDYWSCEEVRAELEPIYDEVGGEGEYWVSFMDYWPEKLLEESHFDQPNVRAFQAAAKDHAVLIYARDDALLFFDPLDILLLTWEQAAESYNFVLEQEPDTSDRERNVHQVDATPTVPSGAPRETTPERAKRQGRNANWLKTGHATTPRINPSNLHNDVYKKAEPVIIFLAAIKTKEPKLMELRKQAIDSLQALLEFYGFEPIKF